MTDKHKGGGDPYHTKRGEGAGGNKKKSDRWGGISCPILKSLFLTFRRLEIVRKKRVLRDDFRSRSGSSMEMLLIRLLLLLMASCKMLLVLVLMLLLLK